MNCKRPVRFYPSLETFPITDHDYSTDYHEHLESRLVGRTAMSTVGNPGELRCTFFRSCLCRVLKAHPARVGLWWMGSRGSNRMFWDLGSCDVEL